MKHSQICTLIVALLSFGVTAGAANSYYVGNAATSGTSVSYRGITYTSGVNAFADFKALVSARPAPGSTVYVDAGIYGDAVTIDVPGLTLLGANAYCDARSANRNAAESVISGELNVTADNVTINGFRFTGAGCVFNSTATNVAPMSGLTFVYNVADGSSLPRNNSKSIFEPTIPGRTRLRLPPLGAIVISRSHTMTLTAVEARPTSLMSFGLPDRQAQQSLRTIGLTAAALPCL